MLVSHTSHDDKAGLKKKKKKGRKQKKGWSNKKPDVCKNWKTVSNGKL